LKKRKLKGFVLPTLYMLITISIFTGVIFLGRTVNLKNKDYNYGVDSLKDNVESVLVEDEVVSSALRSPILDNKATISIHFYDKNDTEDIQQNSLIYYENTYLPNTGVLYTSDEEFQVGAVYDGKVTEIIEDEFFGKCVVVEHINNLRTYYYGLDKIEVELNDEISSGTIIGTSKINEIMNNKKSFLLETYYNNELINPEKVIGTKISDYE